MTLIELKRRFPSDQSAAPVSFDEAFETGAILIDQDAYTVGLERRWDVRGFKNMHLKVSNDGANGLEYSIGKASREVDDVSTLVDADFSNLLTDEIVANGAVDIRDVIGISPESTSIRIQLRRETSGQDTTISGVASFN